MRGKADFRGPGTEVPMGAEAQVEDGELGEGRKSTNNLYMCKFKCHLSEMS